MTLLLALLGGAAPADDLLFPCVDDGKPKRRFTQEICTGFIEAVTVADLLAPSTLDGTRRTRQADAWQTFLAPDVYVLAPSLDDGQWRRRWTDGFFGLQPQEQQFDLFVGVLDDGWALVRVGEELRAYLPHESEPEPTPPSVGGHFAKQAAAYHAERGRIRKQNEAILAVFMAAVTSGALQ